jgi:hypothetical protein
LEPIGGRGSPDTDGMQVTVTVCLGNPGVEAVIPVLNVA